jgi:NADPH2:quinone reductase
MGAERVPDTMRAVRLTRYEGVGALEVEQVPVPRPNPSQVLVRVAAASFLPSDRMFCRGDYGPRRTLPTTPGVEGAGVVIDHGPGVLGRMLSGRRVAFLTDPQRDGSWAEYVAVPASSCVPLWPSIDNESAAALMFNPLTALALIDHLRAGGHRSMFVTAAGGALGRMLVRLGRNEGMNVIGVVRREEQIAEVERLGAQEVILETATELDARLRRACRAWRVTAAIDGVGGELAGRLFSALPDGAELVVLGLRAGDTLPISARELIFHGKRVRGFWLAQHLVEQGAAAILRALPRLRLHAGDALRTEVSVRIGLDEVPQALQARSGALASGKVVILPG